MPRLIAIGDIHGYAAKLSELLRLINPRPTDTLVFLGDYVDRGPDTPGVLDRVLELKGQVASVVTLRGNHEEWLLYARENSRAMEWVGWGGDATIRAYHPETLEAIRRIERIHPLPYEASLPLGPFFAAIPRAHIELIENTVLYHVEDDFIFVHAGLEPGVDMARQRRSALLLGTYRFFDAYTGPQTVVFGHHSTRDLRPDRRPLPYAPRDRRIIGLDTTVYETGVLTGMEVRTRRVWQTAAGE